MPTGAPDLSRSQAVRSDLGPLPLPDPLPPVHLLRTDGSASPSSMLGRASAAALLAADATRLLELADPPGADASVWVQLRIGRGVQAVRRELAPLRDVEMLVDSLAREAGLRHAASANAPTLWESPLRIGYAIRWMELQAGLDLPSWSVWFV